ncbi:hypothetical protein WEI85_01560 [Actinomycetes bacterium KLBMP 9797]
MSDANASIDDLLGHEEEPHPVRARPVGGVAWWIRTVLVAGGFAAVAVLAARLFGFQLPILLGYAGCFALLLLRRAVGAVAPPPRPRRPLRLPAGEESGDYDWAVGEDGLNDAVRRWEQRLSTVSVKAAGGQAQSALTQVVDERLRQRHGFTMASDPDRARTLLGDPLWTLLTRPPKRKPPRDLAAALSHLEKL